MSGRKIEGDSVARHFPFLVGQAQPLHTRAGTKGTSDLRMNGPDALDRGFHCYRNAGAISVMKRSRSRRSSSSGRNMLGMKSVSTPADWSWWSCSRI